MRKLEQTEKYVVGTEGEAKSLIEQFRAESTQNGYTIKKTGYEYKIKKSKKEIIGTAYVVTVTKIFGEIWEDLDE